MPLGKNTLEKNTGSGGRSLPKSATKERQTSDSQLRKEGATRVTFYSIYIYMRRRIGYNYTTDRILLILTWPQLIRCANAPTLFGIVGISIRYFSSIHKSSPHINHHIFIKMNYGTHSLFNQSQSLYC